ncbi:MAG: hypothetical protein QXT23_03135 [Acidilobaceae archaeon]
MRLPYIFRDLISVDYGIVRDEGLTANVRRYVIETTTYTFSTSISSNLVNALADIIKSSIANITSIKNPTRLRLK